MSLRRELTKEIRFERMLRGMPSWYQGWESHADYDDKQGYIEGYISHNEEAKIHHAFLHLRTKGMAKLKESLFLAVSAPERAASVFGLAARYRMTAQGVDILFAKRMESTRIFFDKIIMYLFPVVATGQFDFARQQFNLIHDALVGQYAIDYGQNPFSTWRYATMGVCILGEFFKRPVDIDALSLPRDPAWMPLVQYWNTGDVNQIQSVLLDACDVHMERIALTEREMDSGKFEFASEYEAVYPAEILAVLRLREFLGLENPVLDHPLMNTPYAKLTCGAQANLGNDELLERFFKTMAERDPDIMAGWNAAIHN